MGVCSAYEIPLIPSRWLVQHFLWGQIAIPDIILENPLIPTSKDITPFTYTIQCITHSIVINSVVNIINNQKAQCR